MIIHGFSDMQARNVLRVSEVYASIQGESTRAGCPCFFVRLAGCNLRCSYCDTKYAYAEEFEYTIDEIVDLFQKSGLSLVEVTGGEPLAQSACVELLTSLLKQGDVLIETNGSFDISVIPEGVVAIMDIKCPGSGESQKMDWKNIARLRADDEVKFVVSDRSDFDWALQMISRFRIVEKCSAVLMSPVNKMLEAAQLVEWILKERANVRLNLQLHKLIWDCADRGK